MHYSGPGININNMLNIDPKIQILRIAGAMADYGSRIAVAISDADAGIYTRRLKESDTGFHIQYKVGASKFGRGIFAEEDILKGTEVWNGAYGRNVLRFINEKEVRDWLAQMPNDKARKEWLQYPVYFEGGFELDLDDGKFINHSPNPNLGYYAMEDNHNYALRDIKKGEELFEDYASYAPMDPEWISKLYAEYNIDESFKYERRD